MIYLLAQGKGGGQGPRGGVRPAVSGGGRFCVPSPYWPRLQLGLPVFTIVVPEVPVPSAAHDPHQTPAGAEGAGAG